MVDSSRIIVLADFMKEPKLTICRPIVVLKDVKGRRDHTAPAESIPISRP